MKSYLKKTFIELIVVSICFSCSPHISLSKSSEKRFTFFVLGDWGTKGGAQQIAVARQMIVQSKLVDLSMIATVGDNFYETGVQSIKDEHWQLSYEKVYKELTKKFPWYVSLGNHDYRGNIQAQIEYHAVNANWNMPSRPQIFPLTVASSSGYYNRTVNAVTTQKNGIEVSLTGAVLKNPKGLNWNILANYSTYKETLKQIYGDETSIYLPGPDHVFNIGDRLDGYYGYNYLRSIDGQIIQSSTGVPLTSPTGTNNKKLLGYTNPDFVWGINNQFAYKNFSFSFQFDGRVGGVIYDQVYAYATNSGNQIETTKGAYGEARLKEWQSTNNSTKTATPYFVGPGVTIVSGTPKFDASGNISNDKELSFAPNTKAVTVQTYAQSLFNNNIDEEFLTSKTYMKLREVIVGYSIPSRILDNVKFIKNASISLVGRNLLYFAQRKDFDLDQYAAGYNAASGSTLKNPGLQSATTRRYGVNLNITF